MNAKNVLLLVAGIAVAAGLFWFFQFGSNTTTETESLRLGTNVWPGYEPLYLARSLGAYDEDSVRLVECSSASHVIREFRNNTLEVAALTIDEALILKANGYDVRIILVTDVSDGGDVILAKPEVASLKDLRGRKVGVEHTALGAYVLTRALQTIGMTPGDVTVVPLKVDEHERAFDEGKVDAVVTFDPVRTRLLAKGAVKRFDSTQMPGEIVDVLVARNSTIKERPEKFKDLVQGWFVALDHFREQPDDAAEKMSGRLQLEPTDVLASYDGLNLPDFEQNLRMLGGDNPELKKTVERLAAVMLEQKLLGSEVDVSDLFSVEPLIQMKNK